mgnify:FL=1
MKKIRFILLALLAMGLVANAQENSVLFQVGDVIVTADEFTAVYEKNKGVGAAIDPKTPEEYLDLYITFKLKIAEAYAQHRDTASQFLSEFGGYRAQLAKPYLSDQGAEQELLNEAYTRMQEEVRASHIMIALDGDALPADTLKVYNQLLDLRATILKGKLTFENAARTQSADTWSAKQGGDLGFFTAFSMVYPFESASYELEQGEISTPVRTQYGYHLIKTTDRRPASGTVRIRHIFFAANNGAEAAQAQRAERSAQEIYTRLQNGESFMDLLEYSEDRRTKDKMGELPEFGINKMMPAFEEAAFALENPGDYSTPVQTTIGWHVIQLIEKKPIGSFDSMAKELSKKVQRDSRNAIGAKRFVKQLKQDYNFKIDEKGYAYALQLVNLNAFENHIWQVPARYQNRTVATFADQKVTVSDVLPFWAQNQQVEVGGKGEEFLRLQFNTLCNDKVVAYEDSQLESKYSDFRNLVREYREGILLFDLTQDEVWDKAAKDSAGIALEYERIKENYLWDDRITFNYWVCKESKDANRIAKWLSKDRRDKVDELLESQEALSIAYASGMAQQKEEPVLQEIWSMDKGVYGPVELSFGGYAVLLVENSHPSGPKALNEIKGLVIASYQDQLEKAWVASLREKFDVQVNEEVKAQVFEALK